MSVSRILCWEISFVVFLLETLSKIESILTTKGRKALTTAYRRSPRKKKMDMKAPTESEWNLVPKNPS